MYVYLSSASLTHTHIERTTATVNSTDMAAGGGVLVTIGTVSMIQSTISDTMAYNAGSGSAMGGGVHVWSANVTIDGTAIINCTASARAMEWGMGGGLFNRGGAILLKNSTLMNANRATGSGGNLATLRGSTTYLLPAPAGRFIAGVACVVARHACAVDIQTGVFADPNCPLTFPECAHIPNRTAMVRGTACQPVTLRQPCDWEASPELLGSTIQTLPNVPNAFHMAHVHGLWTDVDFPYLCSGSVGGVPGGDATHQSSPQCAGMCVFAPFAPARRRLIC